MKRKTIIAFAIFASLILITAPVAAAETVSWGTASDWDNATSESNVEHRENPGTVSLGFYDSFEDTDWSEYQDSSGVSRSSRSKVGSYSALISGDAPAFEYAVEDSPSQIHVETWVNYESTGGRADGPTVFNENGNKIFDLFMDEGTFYYFDGDRNTVFSPSADTWYKYEITYDVADRNIDIVVKDDSGSVIADKSYTTSSDGGQAAKIGLWGATTDQYIDGFDVQTSASGSITTTTKSFSAPVAPDLSNLDYALNGQSITVEVVGSPGTADEEVQTVTLDGATSYDLSWSERHTDFRVRAVLDHSDVATSPTLSNVDLTGEPFKKPPSVDNSSATPSGESTVDSPKTVDLSIDVTDPEFPEGDEVTVTYYVDGSQVDQETVTSNGTVTGTWNSPTGGNHTWHVEATDANGNTVTSSTFDFTNEYDAPAVDDSSASPNGESFNDEQTELSVNVSDADFVNDADELDVEIYLDGSVVHTETLTGNGTVSTSVGDLSDGTHDWHVEVSDSHGYSTTSSTYSFTVNHYAPVPDNANATPQDDAEKTTREVTFSVPVNDTDFAETSGDEVQATFYLDGEQLATKNITANGTVSASTTISDGGAHSWHVELVDEYGITNETDADPSTSANEPFTFQAPSEMRIYNESAPNQLVDEVTVNIQFYGGQDGDAFTVQRSTTNGVINMSGLPADQEFIVVVNSDGYHNRRIYVESLYEQANVFLLPTSEEAVYNVFKIDDKSGAYPPGETRIIIQRALNRSGNFTWQTVSGDFFGSTNEHKTYLRYNVRYRLIVENDQGQRRMMGPYFATDENNPKIITVSSIVVSPPEGQSYYGTAFIEDETEDDGQKTLRFAYTDPDEATDSLNVVIHERGNESNVLADVSTDDVGDKWTYSTVLDTNESAKSWVVDWQGQRDGEEIGAMVPVGNRGGLPLPMSQEWLTRFGLIALVVVASLSSERMATIGAMGTVAFAGILMITGIWEIPVVLWFAALIIAVGGHALTKAQRGGVVG